MDLEVGVLSDIISYYISWATVEPTRQYLIRLRQGGSGWDDGGVCVYGGDFVFLAVFLF